MKNFPKKLDSKTTSLRITVPENLDLALEGLIRKVLKEQPKTDDIYSFAANYFETLLQIRDKAGVKYMSSQICPFHNDEDAHEMIKLANSFPKPEILGGEEKNQKNSGKRLSSGKSARKEPEKVITGRRIIEAKGKSIKGKPTADAGNKILPCLVEPLTQILTKPTPKETKIKDEKEDKPSTELESNLEDLEEDEEFLKSDPIKELVERELMSKTTENDLNSDKVVPPTDTTEKEKQEPEKAVGEVTKVIEPQEDEELKEEKESKEVNADEDLGGETTAIGDELCGVVDTQSLRQALQREGNESTTNEEADASEFISQESEKEKPEEGEQKVETPKPEIEETITKESVPEKLEETANEKVEDPQEEELVKQEEDKERTEKKDDEEKPKEPVDDAEEGKQEFKEINEKPKEDAEGTKLNENPEDIKEETLQEGETSTNKEDKEIPTEGVKIEVKETTSINNTTEESENLSGDTAQANSTTVQNESKKETTNEIEENQKEEEINQSQIVEENRLEEEIKKEETPNEEPPVEAIEIQDEKVIESKPSNEDPIKTLEGEDNTSTTEDKSETNGEIKADTKETSEEQKPETGERIDSLGNENEAQQTDIEKSTPTKETPSSDKENGNQNEEPEDAVVIVASDESLKEIKEEEIEEKEAKPENESIISEVSVEEPKSEEKTESETQEHEESSVKQEMPTSETDQVEVKPDKTTLASEKEAGGDTNESEGNSLTEVKTEETKSITETPEAITDVQEKTEDKPEEVKKETEQLTSSEVTETEAELQSINDKESENPEQPKTTDEPEKEPSLTSETNANAEILDEKTASEVETKTEVLTTEEKPKPNELEEMEMLPVDANPEDEAIATVSQVEDDKDLVKDEKQDKQDDKVDESQTETVETKTTEETGNTEDGEDKQPTESILPQQESENIQDSKEEEKEQGITEKGTENENKETADENKPKDTNTDTIPNEENTESLLETRETETETTTEELCSVIDTQALISPDGVQKPEETNNETVKPEDGITIKTITTHYYDLAQVPTNVTKEFKVHRTQDDSLTTNDLSKVGNAIIKSYQIVQEFINNNENKPETVDQDIKPDSDSTNQTNKTEINSDIQKEEIENLNAAPNSGAKLSTMQELFLDSERRLSSYQKEETKFSSLKSAKQSLEDLKIQTDAPNAPQTDEDKQEVEEIVTKTIIPRIIEAVPDPPRETEEINKETNAEETENMKDKKEDEEPDRNSSEDSNEATDSSNNGRSIDSDIPIISVEVRTVIETQILDDDEETSEDNQKGSDYHAEMTFPDGSNDLNVEVEATIEVPIETTEFENGENQNLTDQEKSREQTKKQKSSSEESTKKSSNDDNQPPDSSIVREGSSGESDSTTLTAATEIKRLDSSQKNFTRSSTQNLLTTQSLDSCKRPPLLKTRSLSVYRQGVTDFEIWNTIEKELEEAATKIQSKYRGYTARKKLRREDAVQITTEESSSSTTSVEQELNLEQDNHRSTGEFHDSIVLSIHPR